MKDQFYSNVEYQENLGMKLDPLSIEVPASQPIDVININRLQTKPIRRKRRSRPATERFHDLYEATGKTLGEGSHGAVHCYTHRHTKIEYAVKVLNKTFDYDRYKILKEIDIFHHCRGHRNILQLNEYYEEDDKFYLVFDRLKGGSLFEHIQRRGHISEMEASKIIRELADAILFLHNKGIAHRDLKPENILCENVDKLSPVRICDFDLGSAVAQQDSGNMTPELNTPVGSAEYMAPEVVDAWVGDASHYDKKCDLWSLGIILYIMLCGYPPFYAKCCDDCGWERGEACETCQDILFGRIQDGYFHFPDNEWKFISRNAKDLIEHLLKRDPRQRYSARQVLEHSWITDPPPETSLSTPRILSRSNSSQMLLGQYADHAMAANRMILAKITISESQYSNSSDGSGNPFFGGVWEDDYPEPSLDITPASSHIQFTLGDYENDEMEQSSMAINIPARARSEDVTVKLSPPSSKLAERRKLRLQSVSMSPNSSSPSP